jgi:hypothetical protein
MRKRMTWKLAIILLLALGYMNVKAQVSKDEVQLVQGIWGMQKRDIVIRYMNFSDSESVKFGPIYDAYMDEYKQLGADRINVIADYAQNYTHMTNEKADELTQKLLKNNAAIDKLQLKYYNKIKKDLSAMRAGQFMQLELYMQTMIRAELQSEIPLIGELEKSETQ